MAGGRDTRDGSASSPIQEGKGIPQRGTGGRIKCATQDTKSGSIQIRAAKDLLEGRPHVVPGDIEVPEKEDRDASSARCDRPSGGHRTKLLRRKTIDVKRSNGMG